MTYQFSTQMTVNKSAVKDDFGDPVVDAGQSFVVDGVVVNPFHASTEDNNRRNQTVTTLEVYDPTFADIAARDSVSILGLNYEVVGEPQRGQSPFTGWSPGQVLQLKRVAG